MLVSATVNLQLAVIYLQPRPIHRPQATVIRWRGGNLIWLMISNPVHPVLSGSCTATPAATWKTEQAVVALLISGALLNLFFFPFTTHATWNDLWNGAALLPN